jgi:hypothetical protein
MPIDEAAVKKRMRVIRLAFSRPREAARDFAARMGFGETTWNNYERKQRPSLDAAARLVGAHPGLTLDWIYLGDASTLSFPVREALGAAAEAVEAGSEGTTLNNGPPRRGGSMKSSSSSRAKARTRRA